MSSTGPAATAAPTSPDSAAVSAPAGVLLESIGADPTLIDKLAPALLSLGLRAAGALAFLLAAVFVARAISRAAERSMNRARLELTLARFLAALLRWGLIVVAVVAALGMFGVQTTSFAAALGAAGLAIGLALQGSLSNIAAGAMLAIFRPFKVGDMVNIAGHLGVVDEIELFTTRIDTPDNRRVVVPNGQIFNGVIENLTHHPRRRIDIDLAMDARAPLGPARDALLAAVRGVEGRLDDPAPDVIVTGIAEHAVNLRAVVWAPRESFGPVRQAALRAVKTVLESDELPRPRIRYERLDAAEAGEPARIRA